MAPIAMAGLTQVTVIKLGGLKALAVRPLDFKATLHGRRLFGDNKTWRGVVVMVVATAGWAAAFEWQAEFFHWPVGQSVPFEWAHPFLWGALAGAGYVVGELPNSFVKRRLGIAAGAPAPAGRARAAFWIVVCLIAVTMLVHPGVALIMLCLGLKARVG
jgi:CDP-diglyceride synthetase